jgi:hypothetical protein
MREKNHAQRVQIERLCSRLELESGLSISPPEESKENQSEEQRPRLQGNMTSDGIEQEAIGHLRRQLEDLQRIESGLSSAPPSRPIRDDFTVKEQSSVPRKSASKAYLTYSVSLVSLLGMILAVVAISKMMVNATNAKEFGSPPPSHSSAPGRTTANWERRDQFFGIGDAQ